MIDETGGEKGTETGDENLKHKDNPNDKEFDVFLLAGTSKHPERKSASNVPSAPTHVYHRRGKDESIHFRDKTAAVQTIKICFEKMIEKDTRTKFV